MRILALVPLYPPHHLGGYEVVCQGTMERFAERGHEVVVLTSDTRFPDREEPAAVQGGVTVERALRGWWDWETHGSLHAGVRQRVAIERHSQHAMREAIESFRPDVVSVWSLVYLSFSLVTLAERAGLPVVVNLGDDWITYAPGLDEWTRVFARRPWLRPVGRLAGLETRLPRFAGATVTAASMEIAATFAISPLFRFRNEA